MKVIFLLLLLIKVGSGDSGMDIMALPSSSEVGVSRASLKDTVKRIVNDGGDFKATLIWLSMEDFRFEGLKNQVKTFKVIGENYGEMLSFAAATFRATLKFDEKGIIVFSEIKNDNRGSYFIKNDDSFVKYILGNKGMRDRFQFDKRPIGPAKYSLNSRTLSVKCSPENYRLLLNLREMWELGWFAD